MSEIRWADHELEHLNHCPVCGSFHRDLRYSGIEDRICGTQGKWDYYRCRDCSVLYIDPRPTEETIGRAYEDYFTHSILEERVRTGVLDKMALGMRNDYLNWKYGYKKQPILTGGRWLMYLLPPWLRLEWDHNARHLPIPKPGKNLLLDVGCGNGDFLSLAKSAGWECHGVDFDGQAVDVGRSRGLKVKLGPLVSQHYPSSYFDAITLSHVIEHVHWPEVLIRECVRLLKPGGVLWIATPNSGSILHNWFDRFWFSLSVPQHLILFTPKSLTKLIESCGLKPRFRRRGAHIQSHWIATSSIKNGKSGVTDINLRPFIGRKYKLRYWIFELLVFIFPSYQGDIVLQATKN